MFQSPILDVGVGLILMFLVMALVCTSLNEYIAQILGLRAEILWKAICSLFQNAPGLKSQEFARKVLDHDLVDALSPPGANPSYIPSHVFSMAVLDLVGIGGQDNDQTVSDRLDAAKTANPHGLDATIFDTLKPLTVGVEKSLDMFRQNIESWFNATMSRASGWYKRRIQIITFCVAFAGCLVINADALMVSKALWSSPQTSSKLVADAQSMAKLTPPTNILTPAASETTTQDAKPLPPELQKGRSDVLGLVGWSGHFPWSANYDRANEHRYPANGWEFVMKMFGLLITAIAACLGAPFWFGVLNKVVSIRSSGQPPAANDPNRIASQPPQVTP